MDEYLENIASQWGKKIQQNTIDNDIYKNILIMHQKSKGKGKSRNKD